MENRLLVFVSSLIGELLHEREVVGKAVSAIPLARAWIFEHSPASAEPLAESYLRKVEECDIFILLLGKDISDPVKEEYRTAVEHDKPCLVFLKAVERSPEAQAFINAIGVKWAKFSTTDELRRHVQQAVTDELIKGYRHYRLKATEVGELADFMEQLNATIIVDDHHIQAAFGDVNGQVAVGKGVIQTRDVSAEKSAVALGDRATAITRITHYATDVMRPLNNVLSAFLIVVLVIDVCSMLYVLLNVPESCCGCINFLCSGPVAFYGLVLSVLAKNRVNIALSLLVGAVAILAVAIQFWFDMTGTTGLWPFFQRFLF